MNTPPIPNELDGLETVIVPRTRDLGDGFTVRRALPAPLRQMVGPFIFFDQMGPASMEAGHGLDVRPHPHIGIATVTYLFEGAILHRDSVGAVQRIEPGALNWMNAGSGIVHSERSPPPERKSGGRIFGIQSWVAVPKADEESKPTFTHFGSNELPSYDEGGVQLKLIAGELGGLRSPAPVRSPMFYADVKLEEGAVLALDARYEERAAYLAEGEVEMCNTVIAPGSLAVFAKKGEVLLRAKSAARLMLLGGEPMDGPRHIVWNFVSSRWDRIEQAKEDWRQQRFEAVPTETEFIPLPENLPGPPPYP